MKSKAEIKGEVLYIAKVCMDLTMATNHDAFFRYAAHINKIEVDVHLGGWKSGIYIDYKYEVHVPGSEFYTKEDEKEIGNIINKLNEILKNSPATTELNKKDLVK